MLKTKLSFLHGIVCVAVQLHKHQLRQKATPKAAPTDVVCLLSTHVILCKKLKINELRYWMSGEEGGVGNVLKLEKS